MTGALLQIIDRDQTKDSCTRYTLTCIYDPKLLATSNYVHDGFDSDNDPNSTTGITQSYPVLPSTTQYYPTNWNFYNKAATAANAAIVIAATIDVDPAPESLWASA
jgi:hypothetical protein